jgi:hypothetical protein
MTKSKNIIIPHRELIKLLGKWYAITLPNDFDYDKKLSWCLENCQGKFRDIKEFSIVAWHFENKQDAAIFALCWA